MNEGKTDRRKRHEVKRKEGHKEKERDERKVRREEGKNSFTDRIKDGTKEEKN